LASSSKPTLARMIFCSFVIAVSPERRDGAMQPQPAPPRHGSPLSQGKYRLSD
jgi:hypothetical protein